MAENSPILVWMWRREGGAQEVAWERFWAVVITYGEKSRNIFWHKSSSHKNLRHIKVLFYQATCLFDLIGLYTLISMPKIDYYQCFVTQNNPKGGGMKG